MRNWIKFVSAVLFVGLMSAGMTGCTKTEVNSGDDPSSTILTNIGGLQSRLFTLNGEAVMVASGAQLTDVITMTGTNTYDCEITSVGETNFKFRVPGDLVGGEYSFSIKRGETVQNIGGPWTIAVRAFNPNVPDDGKSSLRGMVYCDSKGVDGVLVTDGVNFTETKDGGKYYLASDKRYGVVYIVLPSGYDVATRKAMPQFWAATNDDASVREQHNFELFKNDNTNHTVLVATDIHLSNRNLYPLDLTQFSAGFVNEVKTDYAGKKSVYCFNLGDFAWDIYWYKYWDGKALENATAQISGLPCQFWSTMGNHDNDGHAGWTTKMSNIPYGTDEYWAKDLEASKPFRTVVGPTHISMNIGKVHYILVDDINYENDYLKGSTEEDATGDEKMGDRNYHAGFRPDVIEWLRKDLSYVDKSTPVVVGFHIPLANALGDAFNGEFGTNMQQLYDFVNLFKDFSEVNFISGHTHVNRMRPLPGYGKNLYEHNIGSVCGIWWNTSQGSGSGNSAVNGPAGSLNLCSDGAPAGYMVYEVQGTSRSWYWKAVGVNKTTVLKSKQFKTYDMNEVAAYYKAGKGGAFLTAITGPGIENSASDAVPGSRIKATAKSYGAEEETNTVWINVWGFEKGDFAGYGKCSVKVIEDGKTTDITEKVNDAAGTVNPIEGYHDPLSAVTFDVYRYTTRGKFSSNSMSRGYANHIFKYIAKSPKSTLTIVYTDRFGNTYREQMQRPKKFWDGANPYYTLD